MSATLTQRTIADGLRRVARTVAKQGRSLLYSMRGRKAEVYENPTNEELHSIELAMVRLGLTVADYSVDLQKLSEFTQLMAFPREYHGGKAGGVYEEKILEHFVAWDLLGLSRGGRLRYVDVAGASSPWVAILATKGIEAYSIDLKVPKMYSHLRYYIRGDATSTSFPDQFFDGASAQCAFEMFGGDSDMRLLAELHRILKPGGRAVIAPLYMHTHPCYYQTPDYWGRPLGDTGAKAYIRRDCWGVPASRKYSPHTLQDRVVKTAEKAGLIPKIHVLRNKGSIAGNIYLHFILVLDRPAISL